MSMSKGARTVALLEMMVMSNPFIGVESFSSREILMRVFPGEVTGPLKVGAAEGHLVSTIGWATQTVPITVMRIVVKWDIAPPAPLMVS